MKVGYQILADLQQQQAFKQWGFEETETKTIAFPISFESIKYVFLSKIYGPASGGADTVAYNFFRKSLTGVSFDYAYTRNWLAIGGKQPQWGKTISGNNVKTKFPIAFTAFCMLSVSVNSSNGNAAESVFRNGFGYTNKTLSDWILRGPTGDATYFADYIAIGCQPQWGKYTNSGNDRVITYPIAFSELYYANVISPDNCETFVYGISNTNINYRLCNGYNDDRWNGTQTSRLFAVGR